MRKNTMFGWLKKAGAALLAACLLAGAAVPDVAYALEINYTNNPEGLVQLENDSDLFIYCVPQTATEAKGTKLDCYYGARTALTLPAKCDNYTVTIVSSNFSTYSMNLSAGASSFQQTRFTSIKIPTGYTTIEENAFADQTALYRIQIPATVKKIASTAFSGCDKSKLTIVAPYGSYAEKYAIANNIHYTNSTALKLQTNGTTMYAGESKQIAVLNNAKTVTWKSSKTSVATVSSTGKVKAKKAGKTTISATIGGKTYSYTFKVIKRTEANVLKVIWKNYVKVGMSDYEKAIAAKNWMDAHVSTTGTSVSATKAFTTGKVNYTGYANAYKKILDHYGLKTKVITGTTHMDNSVVIAGKTYTVSTLASASGVDKTYTTTTCEGVAINKSTMTLSVGKTGTFKPLGVTKAITWSSSNKKVATVNKNGKVTAKAAGTAKITMKMDGKTYQCTVRVNK